MDDSSKRTDSSFFEPCRGVSFMPPWEASFACSYDFRMRWIFEVRRQHCAIGVANSADPNLTSDMKIADFVSFIIRFFPIRRIMTSS